MPGYQVTAITPANYSIKVHNPSGDKAVSGSVWCPLHVPLQSSTQEHLTRYGHMMLLPLREATVQNMVHPITCPTAQPPCIPLDGRRIVLWLRWACLDHWDSFIYSLESRGKQVRSISCCTLYLFYEVLEKLGVSDGCSSLPCLRKARAFTI